MTKQEIFDKVLARFRDGMGRAINYETGFCMYKTPAGNKCAVGIFISDGNPIQPEIAPIDQILHDAQYSKLAPYVPDVVADNLIFFGFLQTIHDDFENWDCGDFNDYGEKAMESLARDYGLNYTPKESNNE